MPDFPTFADCMASVAAFLGNSPLVFIDQVWSRGVALWSGECQGKTDRKWHERGWRRVRACVPEPSDWGCTPQGLRSRLWCAFLGAEICSDLPGPIGGSKTRWCFRSLTKSPCWPPCSAAHNPRNKKSDWCHSIQWAGWRKSSQEPESGMKWGCVTDTTVVDLGTTL